MAHRNRWFTELNSMGIFHGKLLVITRWYLGGLSKGWSWGEPIEKCNHRALEKCYHGSSLPYPAFRSPFLGVISPWLLVIQISYTIFFTTLIASCKHKNYVDHHRSSWKGDLTHGAHNLWPVLDSLQKSVHICAVRIHPQAWQAS